MNPSSNIYATSCIMNYLNMNTKFHRPRSIAQYECRNSPETLLKMVIGLIIGGMYRKMLLRFRKNHLEPFKFGGL